MTPTVQLAKRNRDRGVFFRFVVGQTLGWLFIALLGWLGAIFLVLNILASLYDLGLNTQRDVIDLDIERKVRLFINDNGYDKFRVEMAQADDEAEAEKNPMLRYRAVKLAKFLRAIGKDIKGVTENE